MTFIYIAIGLFTVIFLGIASAADDLKKHNTRGDF